MGCCQTYKQGLTNDSGEPTKKNPSYMTLGIKQEPSVNFEIVSPSTKSSRYELAT